MISLDAEAVRRALDVETAGRLASFDAFDEIGSTNSFLMHQARPEPGRVRVALTVNQTAGDAKGELTVLALEDGRVLNRCVCPSRATSALWSPDGKHLFLGFEKGEIGVVSLGD